MRTTITLDDDVFNMVKRYPKARSMPLGKVLSYFARRGAETAVRTRKLNGLVIVDLAEDADKVTTEDVKKLLAKIE